MTFAWKRKQEDEHEFTPSSFCFSGLVGNKGGKLGFDCENETQAGGLWSLFFGLKHGI